MDLENIDDIIDDEDIDEQEEDDGLLGEDTFADIDDNIDEEAVRIKCRALFLLGQKGASKQCFDKFAQEHLRLLNTYPEISYDEVVS